MGHGRGVTKPLGRNKQEKKAKIYEQTSCPYAKKCSWHIFATSVTSTLDYLSRSLLICQLSIDDRRAHAAIGLNIPK